MSKTLVVSYTPRNGSYTKTLVDEFLKLSMGKTEISYLDLANSPPDLLLTENLNLMMEWNEGKREFTASELAIRSNHDELVSQLLDAENIVVAFPIYNFSLPATVKAWIDAIIVSGKTFSFHPEKGFNGLCENKKALILMVSGFDYNKASKDINEFASATIKENFKFIGIPSEQISAFGLAENQDQLDEILQNSKEEIAKLVQRWY